MELIFSQIPQQRNSATAQQRNSATAQQRNSATAQQRNQAGRLPDFLSIPSSADKSR